VRIVRKAEETNLATEASEKRLMQEMETGNLSDFITVLITCKHSILATNTGHFRTNLFF
jgi:hypothetical protein